MKQFIIMLALFVIPNIIMGQTISGKIVDINQNPIPYTVLQIGPNYGVITNEEGVFTLDLDNLIIENASENRSHGSIETVVKETVGA